MFYLRLLTNSLSIFIVMAFCHCVAMAQTVQLCNDDRQFYTKFFGNDTSVFITKELFDQSLGLYSMSAAVNSNEIDCKTASFKFILMRENQILYTCQYDTVTINTLDSLRQNIANYNIAQGDILIFTDIRVKHYCNPCNSYCYHSSLPMIKIIDNYKTYPSRMYMDVGKHLENKQKSR